MIKPCLQLSNSGRRTPAASCEQTVRIAVNASEIKSPWAEFDYTNNAKHHVQRAITYANIPRLSRFLSRCVCASDAMRHGDEKNSVGIFIAEDAAHVLPIDADRPLWIRVSIKFIHGQAVDSIVEIRWVIVLRYVAGAIHWICIAPAHNASNAMKFI